MKLSSASFLLSLGVAALVHAGCGDDPASSPDAGPDPDPDAGAVPGDPTTGAWRAGFELPGPSGGGSRVEALARGADGTIYLAGIFGDAAGRAARNVVAWDGTDYQALGDGLDGWVRGLAIDDAGALWAAVTSDGDTPGARVYRWDGTSWTTAGAALDGALFDLAIVDGAPVVVGEVTGGVLRFDGAAWAPVGTGAPGAAIEGVATAVAAGPDGPCVAGSFTSIGGVAAENAACWTGAAWAPLGAGLPGGVAVLARSPGGTWYAGGTLTFLIDPELGTYEAGIAVLDGGTWAGLDGGIDNGFINEVRAIAFDGDDVLIGGHFLTAGDDDVAAVHLARWSPTGGWSQLGPGLANDVGVFLQYLIGGHALLVEGDGAVWVGGLFTRAGATPASNLTRLSPAGAAATIVGPRPVLGVGGFVDALAAAGDGAVVAVGAFGFAGEVAATNAAVLDADGWASLAALPGVGRAVIVRDDGAIAVAGELIVDGAPAAFAQWDGAAWTTPGGRVEGAGFALIEDEAGALWLGGELASAGGTPVTNLARLDGATWSAPAAFDARIGGLAEWDGRIVAVGQFAAVDGAPAAGLAIEDADGAGWAELGGGLDGDFAYASAITVSEALGVVIGGAFEGVGGEPLPDLAAWDGAAWSDVGGGVTGSQGFAIVSSVQAYGDGLFVTGAFDAAGGVAAANLAWFDGAAWHALGDGLNDLAESLIVVDDVLFVGGPFTVAGGRPASGIAAWDFAD